MTDIAYQVLAAAARLANPHLLHIEEALRGQNGPRSSLGKELQDLFSFLVGAIVFEDQICSDKYASIKLARHLEEELPALSSRAERALAEQGFGMLDSGWDQAVNELMGIYDKKRDWKPCFSTAFIPGMDWMRVAETCSPAVNEGSLSLEDARTIVSWLKRAPPMGGELDTASMLADLKCRSAGDLCVRIEERVEKYTRNEKRSFFILIQSLAVTKMIIPECQLQLAASYSYKLLEVMKTAKTILKGETRRDDTIPRLLLLKDISQSVSFGEEWICRAEMMETFQEEIAIAAAERGGEDVQEWKTWMREFGSPFIRAERYVETGRYEAAGVSINGVAMELVSVLPWRRQRESRRRFYNAFAVLSLKLESVFGGVFGLLRTYRMFLRYLLHLSHQELRWIVSGTEQARPSIRRQRWIIEASLAVHQIMEAAPFAANMKTLRRALSKLGLCYDIQSIILRFLMILSGFGEWTHVIF